MINKESIAASIEQIKATIGDSEREVARIRNEYQSTHIDFSEEEFMNWLAGQLEERARKKHERPSKICTKYC